VITGKEESATARHRRITHVIATTGLGPGSTIAAVVDEVGRQRGRRIEVAPLPAGLDEGSGYGMVLPYPDHDVVLYRVGDAASEVHSTLHLCGHLLLGSGECQLAPPLRDVLEQLFPDLTAGLITKALSGSAGGGNAEADAELFVAHLHPELVAS
jgi:hypothetical protein